MNDHELMNEEMCFNIKRKLLTFTSFVGEKVPKAFSKLDYVYRHLNYINIINIEVKRVCYPGHSCSMLTVCSHDPSKEDITLITLSFSLKIMKTKALF